MTLKEALESRRRFSRRGVDLWYTPGNFSCRLPLWTAEEILADDWELEPIPKKTVTKWLWADPYGEHITEHFFENKPVYANYCVKLEWSAQEFDVND